ncbi:PTS transporter subunit EIIC [Clostridium sp. AM58-1XD]|uniref:PTS transporter subunit EIIC n=1 Tax=Clostridium sp. AM58-1XD TaxID=2292307 RepID=UPI000E499F0D|nr:PTS transporter subunit EIIC [Clostridium sp. AM58-1XD]RGY94900.1 hypothetical protein DXA13_20185 [Clostridium sp. AM58-1XD]
MGKNKGVILKLQKLAKAFLVPMALIAAASLVMGVSSFFTNQQILELLPFLNAAPVQYIAGLFNSAGSIVMNNLPLIYAITLAATLCDGDREYAAFAGVLGYLAFLTGMSILLTKVPGVREMYPEKTIVTTYGIETVNAGMVGGMLVGIMTAWIHSKIRHVKLPTAFAFFQGSRTVPFVNAIIFIFVGQFFPYLWVWLSKGIEALAEVVKNMGIFGPFVYATVEKLLIPTGLHQIWNTVIRDTAVSGTYAFASGVIEGCRPAYFQYLIEGLPQGASLVEMVKFLRGPQIPMMVFALPAIALAMYQSADKDKRSSVKPLLIAGAFTAFMSNISEPIEFLFLFTAPLLYVVYSALNGLSYLLLYLLKSQLGGTTSSILGFILYGPLRPESRWYLTLLVGIIEGIACYLLFRWAIVKFNIKTPGRGGDSDEAMAFAAEISNVQIGQTSDVKDRNNPKILKAQMIIKGLGGKDNIIEVDNCMSRLRVRVEDMKLVDEGILQKTGCMGIVKLDSQSIQVIYGLTVGMIKETIIKQLEKM